jgi:hypothetical protein
MLGESIGSGTARILTSTDGVTWSPSTLPAPSASVPIALSDVAYGNGKFVAVASSDLGMAAMLISTDNAVSWQAIPQADLQGNVWSGIAFGGTAPGIFVATNQSGDTATSADGLTWVKRKTSQAALGITPAFYPALQRVTYSSGSNSFVAGSNAPNDNGTRVGTLYVSTDGVTWTRKSTGYAENVIRVECSATQCVAATSGTLPALLVSTDLTTWTKAYTVPSGATFALGLAKTSSGWVVAGLDGLLLTSVDGNTWVKTAAR